MRDLEIREKYLNADFSESNEGYRSTLEYEFELMKHISETVKIDSAGFQGVTLSFYDINLGEHVSYKVYSEARVISKKVFLTDHPTYSIWIKRELSYADNKLSLEDTYFQCDPDILDELNSEDLVSVEYKYDGKEVTDFNKRQIAETKKIK